MLNDTYADSKRFIDGTHPIGVASGKVIVYSNDMNAITGKSG